MFYTEALVSSGASSLVGKFYNYSFVILCGETAIRRCFKERFPKAVFQDHTKTKAINELVKAPDTLMQRMPSARKRVTMSSAGNVQPYFARENIPPCQALANCNRTQRGKTCNRAKRWQTVTVPSAAKHATMSSAGIHETATVSSTENKRGKPHLLI